MIEFSWIIFPIEQKHFNLIYVWKLQRLDLWHCRPLSNTERSPYKTARALRYEYHCSKHDKHSLQRGTCLLVKILISNLIQRCILLLVIHACVFARGRVRYEFCVGRSSENFLFHVYHTALREILFCLQGCHVMTG